jgi:hypothetical protein
VSQFAARGFNQSETKWRRPTSLSLLGAAAAKFISRICSKDFLAKEREEKLLANIENFSPEILD